jgi:hypothetical protein
MKEEVHLPMLQVVAEVGATAVAALAVVVVMTHLHEVVVASSTTIDAVASTRPLIKDLCVKCARREGTRIDASIDLMKTTCQKKRWLLLLTRKAMIIPGTPTQCYRSHHMGSRETCCS